MKKELEGEEVFLKNNAAIDCEMGDTWVSSIVKNRLLLLLGVWG